MSAIDRAALRPDPNYTSGEAAGFRTTCPPGGTELDQTRPTAAEIDDAIATWRRGYEARRVALRARLRDWLTRPHCYAVESWTSASGPHSVVWYLGSGRFIEPFDSDPDYLTDHLFSRHFGFGWDLEIGGRTYRLGAQIDPQQEPRR